MKRHYSSCIVNLIFVLPIILFSCSIDTSKEAYTRNKMAGLYRSSSGESILLTLEGKYIFYSDKGVRQFGAWKFLNYRNPELHICKDKPLYINPNYKCNNFTNAYIVPVLTKYSKYMELSFGEMEESNYYKNDK